MKFFEILAMCVEQALEECYEQCLIDWLPTNGAPETFEASVEIECSFVHGTLSSRTLYVTVKTDAGEVLVFIDAFSLVKWSSTRMDTLVL